MSDDKNMNDADSKDNFTDVDDFDDDDFNDAPRPKYNNLNETKKIFYIMYNSIIELADTISMPTDTNIEMMVKVSVVLFLICGVCRLLNLFTFISWQGSLINAIILIILMMMEKGESNAISRMYRNAQLSIKKARSRKKRSGKSNGGVKRAAGTNKHKQPATRKRSATAAKRPTSKSRLH